MNRFFNRRATVGAVALALGGALSLPAWAAEDAQIEEVVVTGSYIRGSSEDAELPIDVITNADLVKMGSPSIIEMVRTLGVTAANLGETNQFTTSGQANEGVATVNLRGLGASRTLVLINGRRHVATEQSGLDLSAFPMNAIGRVEILKDGAAAVYGSDAVGGVVNFFTREGFEGLEIGGSFQDVDGSDGDWNINGLFGTSGDNWNWMVAGEYGERGELPIKSRDWALVQTDRNAPGGWSGIGNPATNVLFVPVAGGQNVDVNVTDAAGVVTTQTLQTLAKSNTKAFADPQCEALGALRTYEQACGFNYGWYDNLIEKTEQTKLFTEFNYDLSDDHHLHIEALYADVDLPAWKTSPSYPPQSLYGPDRRILTDHPGWVDFDSFYGLTDAGGAAAITEANILAAGGLDVSGLAAGSTVTSLVGGADAAAALAGDASIFSVGRVMGVGGRYNQGLPEDARRRTETQRFVIGLDGQLFNNELDYDVSIAWSKRDREVGGNDMYVERMGLALKGYGGPGCELPATTDNGDGTFSLTDPAAAAAAAGTNGCEYYNPYSRAIAKSFVNGVTNADYNPAVANSEELLRWMIGAREWNTTNELLVFQAVFSGETNWDLGGGNIGYAVGAQTRNEKYESTFNDLSNRAINPCPYTLPVSAALGIVAADQLTPNCSSPTGVAAFLAASDEKSTERTVYGVFGELAIPLTADIDIQAALRFEDYGGNVGSTLDPKIAASWRLTEEFSLRGSASTTFRGPPQSILSGTGTALSFVGQTNAFKAVDTVGNPNLGSESAVSTNFGAVYDNGTLRASIDWWAFTFEDSFQTESFNSLLSAYTSNSCTGSGGVVTDSAICNELRTHIFPVASHTNLGRVERIVVNYLNGEEVKTSGIDFRVGYQLLDVLPGAIGFDLDGSYVLEYKLADQFDSSGTIKVGDAEDLVGKLNYNRGSAFTSKPELKTNFTVSYTTDDHYASLITRYIGSYDDTGAPAYLPWLATVKAQTTFDAHYNYQGFEGLTLSLSVVNIGDEDPPEARGDLAYDPFTHNAFGRLIKVGVNYVVPL